MPLPVAEIGKKLGYTFKDKSLLHEAFTHSSYVNKHGGKDNERMEYLGDTVLQLVVTEWQYFRDEKASEGRITAERQKLVCKNALDSAAEALGLDNYLLIEGGKQNVGSKTVSSVFEAVIAAIYLDGGYNAAKQFVLAHGNLHAVEKGNPKGDLKEFLEKLGEKEPRYESVKTGSDHSPLYHATVYALGESAVGEGKTKRQAEATAAARLLWELKKNPPKRRKNKRRDKEKGETL